MCLELLELEELGEKVIGYCSLNDIKNLSLTNSEYNRALQRYLQRSIRVPETVPQDDTLKARLESLHYTEVLYAGRVLPKTICEAVSILTSLQELHLRLVEDDALAILCQRLVNMKVMSFSGPQTTSKGLSYLPQLLSLQRLQIHACPSALLYSEHRDVDPEIFSFLAKLNGLQELDLRLCVVGNTGFRYICSLSQLRKLGVFKERVSTDEGFADMAVKLPKLEELNLRDIKGLGDVGFSNICCLINLKKLDLNGCGGIRSNSFGKIDTLVHLEELRVSCCAVQDSGFKAICQLDKLKELDMSFTQVTSEGLNEISWLTLLERFNMRGCMGIHNLDISVFENLVMLSWVSLDHWVVSYDVIEASSLLANHYPRIEFDM